jgi:hypothetical protein
MTCSRLEDRKSAQAHLDMALDGLKCENETIELRAFRDEAERVLKSAK